MTDAEYDELYRKVVRMYARQGRPFQHYKRLYKHFTSRYDGLLVPRFSHYVWSRAYEIGIP